MQLGKLSNLLRPQGKGKSLNDPTHRDREGEGEQGGGKRARGQQQQYSREERKGGKRKGGIALCRSRDSESG